MVANASDLMLPSGNLLDSQTLELSTWGNRSQSTLLPSVDGLREVVPHSADARVGVAESEELPEANGWRTTRAEATYFVVPVQASKKSPERIIFNNVPY